VIAHWVACSLDRRLSILNGQMPDVVLLNNNVSSKFGAAGEHLPGDAIFVRNAGGSPSYESGSVVHCKCNPGYENRSGACTPIPGMQAKREPTMRAMTRTECIQSAGKELQRNLAACQSPIVSCLVNAGVRIHEATCAASTLVSALVVGADPSKVSSAVVGPAIAGALVVCAREAYDAVEKCDPVWGACQNGPPKAHKDAIAACPN
jgi:hypothetical protein